MKEAERALFPPGLYITQNALNFSGEGIVTGFEDEGNTGAAITFKINAPSHGNQKLKFKYANGSGKDQQLSLYMEEEKVRKIVFTKLENWDAWGEVTVELELKKGNNAVLLKKDPGDGYVNIDYIEVE
jgi:hypothetical protein